MEYYREEAKEIPVKEKVDVLVAGAGPAGVAAAISAARQGAKTMLLEQSGCVGGVATSGLMSHWTGDTEGGIYEEILQRSGKSGGTREELQLINPEVLKTELLKMLSEAGVILQLYTFVSGAIMEGSTVTGVITESKSGREAVMARVVIDATGDGDIAARAGVPYHKGREEDGKMQPMTLMFKVGGVDTERAVFPKGFEETFELPKGDLQTLGREHLKAPAGHVLLYPSTMPGVVTCNMTNCIEVDGTKAEELTTAEVTCRGQLDGIVRFLKEFVPGFESCYLISSASMIGVRETRHFAGEYTLTEEDILSARVFEDWAVTRAHFNFDVHGLAGPGLDETGSQKKFTQKKGYTIPYRCFVPKKVDGLLLAGRDISGTHLAHSNYRVMPICANMGQAVGIAASMSAKQNVKPRDINVKDLQQILTGLGGEVK